MRSVRRLITYCLLFLFLLNALGFYGIFAGLHWKNGRDLNSRLDDNQYSAAETRTFKIPLHVPYGVDSKDFERVEGEFQYEGETFRLVKQRLHRDTLELVVVRDAKSKEINQALADYVKTFTDKPESAKSTTKITFDFSKDFLSTRIAISSQHTGWSYHLSPVCCATVFIPTFSSSIVHPPEKA